MLDKSTILKHYKREDIQEAILKHARDKEIGTRFGEYFGKRPDVLTYPGDILELALRDMTSLHSSEERWENPLALHSNITKKELDELRVGWDLVLDIDCTIFEYSRICADLTIKFLQYCGVKDVSCKFSGNKGFHIGVPFEAFPKTVGEKQTRLMFPDAARKIAAYVTHNIKEELGKRILAFEQGNIAAIKDKVELPIQDIIYHEKTSLGDSVAKLRVDKFLEIDTVLIASRHLYRMPFSLHEKSGLASIPIDPKKVMEFEKHMAKPQAILTPMFEFLGRDAQEESARNLLVQALDFEVKEDRNYEVKEQKEYEEINIESPITEELFPPCMKKILEGMEDGKKRGLFCLMNFLGKIGWGKSEIKELLTEWNKRNPDPLRENYIQGQLAHFKPGAKLPPNCDTDGYYKALGLACDGNWCQKIKNPVNYTLSKWRRVMWEQKMNEKRKKTQRDSQKEEQNKENKGVHSQNPPKNT